MNSIGKKYVDGFSSALKKASRPIKIGALEKKTWKTWRQWFKAGQKDHLAGKPIAYPNQPNYLEGYHSVLVTSKEWDATARAVAYSEKYER